VGWLQLDVAMTPGMATPAEDAVIEKTGSPEVFAGPGGDRERRRRRARGGDQVSCGAMARMPTCPGGAWSRERRLPLQYADRVPDLWKLIMTPGTPAPVPLLKTGQGALPGIDTNVPRRLRNLNEREGCSRWESPITPRRAP
jgi:hypothetical protein